MTSQICLASPEDFPTIAELIEKLNQNPDTQCIHSSTGESAESMVAEMLKWHQSGEIIFIKSLVKDRLVGVMGCEFESDGQRGWLRGPFSLSGYESVFSSMYDRLLQALSPKIKRLDSFLNLENVLGQEFYEQLGFERKGQSHVYVAAQADRVRGSMADDRLECVELDLSAQSGFAELHDAIFPNTYYNGEQIISQLDANHRVWVCVSEGEVKGYIFAINEPWAEEGYIEFLSVKGNARGQGLGGKLLTTALDWFFDECEMPQVGLTVSDENVNARGLYERVGFRLKYSGINHRLEW